MIMRGNNFGCEVNKRDTFSRIPHQTLAEEQVVSIHVDILPNISSIRELTEWC